MIIIKSFNHEKKNFYNNIIFNSQFNIPFKYNINALLSNKITINNNYVLIIEPFNFHYECTSGFAKYFINCGYNVDIIMQPMGISSLCNFQPINKVRLFIYEKINVIIKNDEKFKFVLKNYSYILIETVQPIIYNLCMKLNLLNINNSFFVFHHIDYAYSLPFKNKLKNFQIWSLRNFTIGLEVNPNYFGYIKIKKKNLLTKFFITSTWKRKYDFLISAAENIKNSNIKFEVIVVGKTYTFSKKDIPKSLNDNFHFKYRISYSELYEEVYNSDYIIINLDPNNKEDLLFNNIRVTGSVLLSYGFLKPVLINEYFASFYHFNSCNSFIFKKSNFSQVMKNAINLNFRNYKRMQKNLQLLSKEIFKKSLYNVKNCIEMF